MQPDSPTNILLAALGTTPQIITESLYHLMVLRNTFIREIHLITTIKGKSEAEKKLFQNGEGPFYQFCREYGFSSTEINLRYHIITDAQGNELVDIRTPEENHAAADFFLAVTRTLTNRADTRIFATIAGGRKTMSAYLYLTMLLLGRDQDTLYHVLVQPESIESNSGFFYPKPGVTEMEFTRRDNSTFRVAVADMKIDMAEIPFVRMRRILQPGVIDSIARFSELVSLTQERIDRAQYEPEVEVDLPAQKLRVTDRERCFEIPLRPVEMCLYAYLSKRGPILNSKTLNEKVAAELKRIHSEEYAIANVTTHSFNHDSLQQACSRINRKIRQNLLPADQLYNFLSIHSDKKRGGPTYSLKLSPEKIRLTADEPNLFP